MKNMYYKLVGKKVVPVKDVLEWGRWFENRAQRIVKQELLPNGYYVSTVFLGIDHSFSMFRNTPPVVFETMVFDEASFNKYGGIEEDMDRYTTYKQAELGHQMTIDRWKTKKRILIPLRMFLVKFMRRYANFLLRS